MTSVAKAPLAERDETDESLRAERNNSDSVIAEARIDVEEHADAVIERAREQADAVLVAAREKADQKLDPAEPTAPAPRAMAQERAREDAAVEHERAVADRRLRRERAEEVRTLAALLPLEREKTDRFLLTERVRSDDALAHRDEFMGMVSHDLRNLLSGIVMNAMLLSEEASDSDEGRRTVAGMKRIERYAARMKRLIGDLVDIVSIDAGKLAVVVQRNDVAALIAEAVEAFAQAAAEKGITLETGKIGPMLEIEFDHERLLQVLANLINNALKFTPRAGRIVVSGERVGDAIEVRVSDTGAGIPGDMLEAVFERFCQLGENDQRGLGLGLHISRSIVDAHGGKIWAESKLGEGSVFHFTVPITASPAPRSARRAGSAA
ncbi:MAG: ATP-binding protein [Byssovorax sp.]